MYLDRCVVAADSRLRAPGRLVAGSINQGSEKPKALQGCCAYRRNVFADAAAEYDAVTAAEHGDIGAEVFSDAVTVELDEIGTVVPEVLWSWGRSEG